MAGIDVKVFRGFSRRIGENIRPDEYAVQAYGGMMDGSGHFLPLLGTKVVDAASFNGTLVGGIYTIFKYDYNTTGSYAWLAWRGLGVVTVARGPVSADTYRRVYYTGDGLPKFTYNALYSVGTGEFFPKADGWRYLGIPAPAAAPTVTAPDPPAETSTGLIAGVTTATLKMIKTRKGREAHKNGNGQSVIWVPTDGAALATCLVGERCEVVGITDANNVTVGGIGGLGYAFKVEEVNYGFRWTNSTGNALWAKRQKCFWNFQVATGATLNIPSHDLLVGDVIRFTVNINPMIWEFTNLTATPSSDLYFRTAAPTAGSVVFAGSASYVIERGGSVIDPLASNNTYDVESRVYVYTYVSNLGEEGAPSDGSVVVTVQSGDTVTVSGFTAPPTDHQNITHRRIYRTNTGSAGTELQFVAEIPLATTSYNDTLAPGDLGEVLQTEDWLVPPADLKCIRAMPNGSMVGLSKRRVCFSEPYHPHAWPEEYQYDIDYDGVGLEVFGNSVFVGTQGAPYVFTGVHPRQMSPRRISVVEPLQSQEALVNVGDRVLYISPNGIMSVSDAGVENFTADAFTPEQWRTEMALEPDSSYRMFFYNNNIVDIVPLGPQEAFSQANLTAHVNALGVDFTSPDAAAIRCVWTSYVDEKTRKLYTLTDTSTVGPTVENCAIVRWDFDNTAAPDSAAWSFAYWKSRRFQFDRPVNMSFLAVDLEGAGWNVNNVTVDTGCDVDILYYRQGQGVELYNAPVTNLSLPKPGHYVMRLPAGILANEVAFVANTYGPLVVTRVRIGETIEDIQ